MSNFVEHFIPKGSSITSQYCADLPDGLGVVIRDKRRGKLSIKAVLLQQDNTRVHNSKVATGAVERNWYEIIPPPAYSPGLAPSDELLFPNFNRAWLIHFRSNEEVKTAV